MSALPPVAVVFSACNHAATLRALLDALDATDWPGLQVIAVDCGSTDGGLQQLRQRAARAGGVPFTLLERPGAGRATALAAGFAAAGRVDVVRLHADVVPDAPDWLHRLHTVLTAHPDCGIVGGKITLAGGRIQTCGRRLISGLGIVPEWSDQRWLEADRDDAPAAKEVDGVGGELCWIRRAVLDATGGLDTNYDPVFGDDDDLCLMARWHGFSVFVEPAVRGVHYAPRQSTTTGGAVPDPSGVLARMLDDRHVLLRAHRDYFAAKWGFDPEAPDLHEVRRRYGHTRICWRIGERLTERLPERPAVDVCFVTWNSMALLGRAMEHLAATRWPDVRVWVTDNGSTDGTVEYLESLRATFPFPLHVERLAQNVGVAAALNLAFARGNAPLVARLDDDTLVSPDWLLGLVPRFHQRPYAGLVGPRILNDDPGRSLQCGPAREFPAPFAGLGPESAEAATGLCRVVTIRGCCNVYRRSVFAEVGLLDPRFAPSQFDEWDHQIALAVAGYEVLYDGDVSVRHLLCAGRMATPASIANSRGNLQKSNAKWGNRHFQALDRGIDLSIDGRFLPPDGDTRALRAALPPVPAGPPRPVDRDPAELGSLLARARRRSLVRGLQGPLQAWWNHQIDLVEQALAAGRSTTGAMVGKLMDLLPQDPRALMAVADFRRLDGARAAAAATARWALRLRPDDPALQAAVARHGEPAVELPSRPPASPRQPAPARVLLVPPTEHADDVAHHACELVGQALARHGVPFRVERRFAPDPRGCEVVHCFGLADPSAAVGRLQVVRAAAPRARIVLSSLCPDPAPANWVGQVLGPNVLLPADDLRRLLQAVAAHQIALHGSTVRRHESAPYDGHLAYERRCLQFVDALVVHSAAELTYLQSRHPSLPGGVVVAEGAPPASLHPGPDPEVPFGGALAIGPRDLPGHHVAMVLALQGSGVPLSLCGRISYPFTEWHTQRLGDAQLSWLPPRTGEALAAAFRRSAVCVWLPAAPAAYALPLQAAAAGCELVLARGVGAEDLFGGNATYVDPCDLPAVRAAVLAARAAWRADPQQPWRRQLLQHHTLAAYGERLLAVYGLPTAVAAAPASLQPA